MQVANVPEILFKPVYFRAKETQRSDAIIQDPIAVEILQKISPNLSGIDDWTIQFGIVIHTMIVDNVVKQFLQQHPDAVIITLGGGLATRPLLMDNGQAEWFCVDDPAVETYWNQLIGTSDRNHFVSSIVTDLTWIDRIPKSRSAILFVAEGVFLYLTEQEVKQVVLSLQEKFPGSEIVMEVIGKFILYSTQLFRSKAIPGGCFRWGIDDCHQMESWSPGIKMLKEYFCSDYYPERQGYMNFLPYLVGGKRRMLKVAHLCLER
jgi:O-methyltransferase involved in polyketide biosynthesis